MRKLSNAIGDGIGLESSLIQFESSLNQSKNTLIELESFLIVHIERALLLNLRAL